MTNVEYQNFMSAIKEKIVTHLIANDEVHCLQMGFTRERGLEDNLFMLLYCLRSAERMKKNLIITAVDFAKAFESVSRVNFIKTLVSHKFDPRLIDVIAELYSGDETVIRVNGEMMGLMKVKSGIKQGCTWSPQLFLLILNIIIKEIQ